MASKDVTSFFGSIRFVLPLVLIFFIAAGSAIACPKHTSKAAHRTKSLNTRTVSYAAPVVITYGGRCADKRAKYVSVRDNGYYEGGTRYVAVRQAVPRTRYVAVRDDVDYAPRYVAVRRKPVYVDSGTRYVAVRNYAPRPKLVEVRHFDDGYARPTYVNVQRVPVVDDYFDRVRTTRAVAVRRLSNGCARVVTCGNRLDNVETTSMKRVVYRDNIAYSAPVQRVAYRAELDYSTPARHEVVKTDFIDGTEEVIYSSPVHDDSAFVDHLDGDAMIESDVAYTAPANVSYVAPTANLDVAYVADRNEVNPCTPFEPTEPCSGAIARTVSYGTAAYNDIDFDDQAFLDTDDVTYVAAGDVEDACLSPVSYYESAPVVTTRVVSRAKTDSVAYDSFDRDIEPVFVDDAAPPADHMSVVDNVDLVDTDTAYIASDDCRAICAEDEADLDMVSYVDDANPADTMPVTYVPVETVQYVPVETVRAVPVEYVEADDCDTVVTTSGGFAEYDPMVDSDVYYSDSSGQFVSGDLDDSLAEMDVGVDVQFDPYMDEASAEIYSDADFV